MFGEGELVSLARTVGLTKAGRIFNCDGSTQVAYRSESIYLELFEPEEIVNIVEFLGIDVLQAVGDSLNAFCQVLATGFVSWTSEIIVGDFRLDPELFTKQCRFLA